MTLKTLDNELQKPHCTSPSGSNCSEEFVAEPAICVSGTDQNQEPEHSEEPREFFVSVFTRFFCPLSHSVLPFSGPLEGARQPSE